MTNPLINTSVTPSSEGAIDAAIRQDRINDIHLGNPAFDTADFADNTPGNLRVDYVLPSQNLEITDAGVFWPTQNDPLFPLVGDFDPNVRPTGFPSSDHRLVWTDVTVEDQIVDSTRKRVFDLDFLGEVQIKTGFIFNNTQLGGLSGITYDPFNQVYYAISDDRSQRNAARFYTVDINLTDLHLDEGDIAFNNVTTLLNANNLPFPALSIDLARRGEAPRYKFILASG